MHSSNHQYSAVNFAAQPTSAPFPVVVTLLPSSAANSAFLGVASDVVVLAVLAAAVLAACCKHRQPS